MDDNSASGIIDGSFITETDAMTVYESSSSRGFNQVVKVRRQGKWFILKGLKSEYRDQQAYIELLKKEFELATQLDHPNIVTIFAKEMNPEIGPCIVMEYVDGMTLDEFLATKPSAAARKKVVEQLVADKYVDEARYASAFAREKASLQGWGPVKIRFQLRGKGIKDADIAAALAEVEPEKAEAKLQKLLEAKARTLKGDPQGRLKLIKYALSRGYDYDVVEKMV